MLSIFILYIYNKIINKLTNFYHDLLAKAQNKKILFIHIPKTGGMAMRNTKFYKDKVYAYITKSIGPRLQKS